MADWKPPAIGAPVWIEIPATGTVNDLKTFYSSLFPQWNFRAAYKPVAHEVAHCSFPDENQSLSGGIVKMPEGCKTQTQPMGSGMTVYFHVEDLDETEEKVHALGGSTCLKKQKEADSGWIMNFCDPQGNRFGAYQVKR